jgi:hypothetical protein
MNDHRLYSNLGKELALKDDGAVQVDGSAYRDLSSDEAEGLYDTMASFRRSWSRRQEVDCRSRVIRSQARSALSTSIATRTAGRLQLVRRSRARSGLKSGRPSGRGAARSSASSGDSDSGDSDGPGEAGQSTRYTFACLTGAEISA